MTYLAWRKLDKIVVGWLLSSLSMSFMNIRTHARTRRRTQVSGQFLIGQKEWHKCHKRQGLFAQEFTKTPFGLSLKPYNKKSMDKKK
jgi:hypothetical protein